MKEKFLELKSKPCADLYVLHIKAKSGEEIFIYMHNASVSKDGSFLVLKGCYRNFSFDEITEMELTTD